MEYIGFGEIFVFFIGPLIAPACVLVWFFLSKSKKSKL